MTSASNDQVSTSMSGRSTYNCNYPDVCSATGTLRFTRYSSHFMLSRLTAYYSNEGSAGCACNSSLEPGLMVVVLLAPLIRAIAVLFYVNVPSIQLWTKLVLLAISASLLLQH
jgi:hypothetical protein